LYKLRYLIVGDDDQIVPLKYYKTEAPPKVAKFVQRGHVCLKMCLKLFDDQHLLVFRKKPVPNGEKLYNLGYKSQLVTGYYGDITFNNVAYLQIVKGLVVTGWVDEATYKVLMDSKTDISEEIETMQKQPNTLPLSKTDIKKVVKVVTVGANQYYDCTEVLNEVFVNAAKEARQHQLLYPNLLLRGSVVATSADGVNLLWFASKVCDRADWDIKIEDSWKRTVGTTFPSDNGTVMFYGKLYTISELGNMLYGYAGTAMKIPEEILYICGGLVATKSLEFIFLKDYGDGEDRPLIKEGIEWYKKQY